MTSEYTTFVEFDGGERVQIAVAARKPGLVDWADLIGYSGITRSSYTWWRNYAETAGGGGYNANVVNFNTRTDNTR